MGLAELVQLLQTLAPLFQALTPLAAAASKMGADAFVEAFASGQKVDEKLSTIMSQVSVLDGLAREHAHAIRAVEALNRTQDVRITDLETAVNAARITLAALASNGSSHASRE